jgi:hypothetical protein
MRTAVVRFAAFAKAEFHSLPLVAADRAIAPDKLEPYGAYIALTIRMVITGFAAMLF